MRNSYLLSFLFLYTDSSLSSENVNKFLLNNQRISLAKKENQSLE